MIVGVGTDLVEVNRLGKIIYRWGDRFVRRVYSPGEIAYCRQRKNPAIHYAARFAAKEAFLKSIGIGLGKGIPLSDIEVTRGNRGEPHLHLSGKAEEFLRENGGGRIHLSLTHTTHDAAAFVIIET